ncbi:hypothetical protein CCP3SC1_2000004 [Gammaproteobacteria bacterium]
MVAPVYNDDSVFENDDIDYTCQSLKAICHPVRIEILALVGNNAFNVQEIAELVGLSQSTTSQHLAVLRARDLLVTRKIANRVYYQVRNPRLLEFIEMMNEVFANPRATRTHWSRPEVGMANISRTSVHAAVAERM